MPELFELFQNYPNPFNPSTTITYSIPKTTEVMLTVYNLLGDQVVSLIDEMQLAGLYEVIWHGEDDFGHMVGSGIYFYEIKAGNYVKTHKMMLLQ